MIEIFSADIFPNMSIKDKLILFLPTWRSDKTFNLFAYEYEPHRFKEILSENNAFMIVNFHPFVEDVRLNNRLN